MKTLCECGCGRVTGIAARTSTKTGAVKGHPNRFVKGHQHSRPRAALGHARVGNLTSEYNAYRAAKARCTCVTHPLYRYYGGRGIKFKFDSFVDFFRAVGNKPSKQLVLDRIDNDGHYEKGNVRWVTRSTSNKNKRPRYSVVF